MITFAPECTLPVEGPAFVQGPDVRSTMDIVWGSLAVILLCTWSILHLNVPPRVRPLPPTKTTWQWCKRAYFEAWYPVRRKLKWLLLTIVVPENIFGLALSEFVSARQCSKQIQAFQRSEKLDDEDEFTLAHAFYANMGGIVIKFAPEPIEIPNNESGDPETKHFLRQLVYKARTGYRYLGAFDWDAHRTHYHLAQRWIDEHRPEGTLQYHPARALIGDVWTLTASQLLTARQAGIIARLPTTALTAADIDDKNKGDLVVKLLALGQVLWLIIQLCARAAKQRPVSPLEITALAYAACSCATYLLLLKKPQDVRRPTVVHAERSPTYEEFALLMETAPELPGFINNESQFESYALPTSCVSRYRGRGYWNLRTPGLFGGLTVFGSLHLIAWDFPFPNETEQKVWRVLALLTTLVPIFLLATYGLFRCLESRPDAGWLRGRRGWWCGLVAILVVLIMGSSMLFIFTAVRLGLLFEAFRSTYYLPPDAYLSTWANEIPHAG